MNILAIVVLTCLSAYGDSRGFLWTADAWKSGSLSWSTAFKAFGGYAFGIVTYIAAVGVLRQIADIGIAFQATGWFLLTVVGVALAEGAFLSWRFTDQALAVAVIMGFAFLMFRVS